MNHDYESVKETMITQGIDIPESYIERALKERGFDKFPEVGLSNIGLTKLVKTATDIYHSEVDLTPRKSYSLFSEEDDEEKPKPSGSLESQVVKEEGTKLISKIGEGIAKCIAYPIGTILTFPTTLLKAISYDNDLAVIGTILGGVAGTIGMYTKLALNPKLILPVALTQIATNLASLGYEYKKMLKKRKTPKITSYVITEEIIVREKCFKENNCRRCRSLKCPYSYAKKE